MQNLAQSKCEKGGECMILKAGTYKWNDVVDIELSFNHLSMSDDFEIPFISNGEAFTTITRAPTNQVGRGSISYVKADGTRVQAYWDTTAYDWENGTRGWYPEYQSITFFDDIEADDTFGTWFIDSTDYNEVNTPKKITLKAGTYRFNDVLVGFPEIDLGNAIDYFIPISFNYNGKEYLCMGYGHLTFNDGSPMESLAFIETYPSFIEEEPELVQIAIWAYQGGGLGNSYVVETPVYITITKDTEVDNTFGTWYIANTDYNEVNSSTSGVTITWNGDTTGLPFATLNDVPFYKVSDRVFSLEECWVYIEVIENYDTSTGNVGPSNVIGDNCIIIGSGTISGKAGDYIFPANDSPFTLPEDGTYFASLGDEYISSLTLPNAKEDSIDKYASFGFFEYQTIFIRQITSLSGSIISWDQTLPKGTEINLYTKLSNGEYVKCENGGEIKCLQLESAFAKETLWIKVELSTTDLSVSPTFSNLRIKLFQNNNNDVIVLKFKDSKDASIRNAVGDVTVQYFGTTLLGENGPVPGFNKKFVPDGLIMKSNPHAPEHIQIVGASSSGRLIAITHDNAKAPDEHLKISNATFTAILTHINDI